MLNIDSKTKAKLKWEKKHGKLKLNQIWDMEITYLGNILADELQTHSENNPLLSGL